MLTVLAALTVEGVLASMTIESPIGGDVFLAFLEHVLEPRLQPGHIVVLDNLGAHKVDGVRGLIESCGAQLLYLPPYSPDFNPIEQAWSKLKQLLRGARARVLDQLEPAIARAIAAITPPERAGVLLLLRIWCTVTMKMLSRNGRQSWDTNSVQIRGRRSPDSLPSTRPATHDDTALFR